MFLSAFLNESTRKFRFAYVSRIVFLLDGADLEKCWATKL